jgi:hypothetical protein
VEKGRGEKMLASVTDGLLSGLEMQAELSELLEELYYESLRQKPERPESRRAPARWSVKKGVGLFATAPTRPRLRR